VRVVRTRLLELEEHLVGADEEHVVSVRWTPFSRPKWGLAKVEPAGLNSSS